MRKILSLIAGFGDFIMSLSDRTRFAIVIVAIGLLGGGGIYKLVVSIQKLKEPLPAATPAQMIKPMEELFRQSSTTAKHYQQASRQGDRRLDSLARMTNDLNNKYHEQRPFVKPQ